MRSRAVASSFRALPGAPCFSFPAAAAARRTCPGLSCVRGPFVFVLLDLRCTRLLQIVFLVLTLALCATGLLLPRRTLGCDFPLQVATALDQLVQDASDPLDHAFHGCTLKILAELGRAQQNLRYAPNAPEWRSKDNSSRFARRRRLPVSPPIPKRRRQPGWFRLFAISIASFTNVGRAGAPIRLARLMIQAFLQ